MRRYTYKILPKNDALYMMCKAYYIYHCLEHIKSGVLEKTIIIANIKMT